MEEKVNKIIGILKDRYDDALCALHYGKDYVAAKQSLQQIGLLGLRRQTGRRAATLYINNHQIGRAHV